MKKCPFCEKVQLNDSNYCKYCGSKLVEVEPESTETTFYLDDYQNRRKYISSIIIYFISFYLISSIISIIIASLWKMINIGPNSDIDQIDINKFNNDVLAWTNFLTYVVALAIIIPLLYIPLKRDIKNTIKNPKFNLKWTIIGIGIMYLATYLSGIIVMILTFGKEGSSENQEAINEIMKSGGINLVLIAILTIIFAPILEELIFRKCLFKLFKKNTIKTVIFSSIIFASIHIVPACITILIEIFSQTKTFMDLYLEFVYIFSYMGQAFAISYVYYKTNGNVVPSILIHVFNNLLSFIVNLILFT